MIDDDDGFSDQTTTAVPQLRLSSAPTVSYVVRVVEGPNDGLAFTLDATRPSRVLIGTSAACDIRLADRHASRRHAAAEIAGRHLRLTDLESTNGTFVGGVQVGEAYLRGGEVIQMGNTTLRIEVGPVLQDVFLSARTTFGGVIGASVAMRRLYPLCERLAATDVPVVLEGETGTGKEHLAEALHTTGPRGGEPFVVFDCTAVAPNLVESELFGHERGAFTGSVATHLGVFERANGGTLLIDEIGDLPLELQPKLLRAIERSEITRIGGQRTLHVDVRILAATRRNLDRETQLGRFRDDLFHRIAVTRIELPPLRNRQGDVSLLARYFCEKSGASAHVLTPTLLARWESYGWPGNVRELRNAVARWLAIGDLQVVTEQADCDFDDLGGVSQTFPDARDMIGHVLSLELPLSEARQKVLDSFERRYVEHVLETHGGNVTRAAAAAGVARRHLQRIKAKHEPG